MNLTACIAAAHEGFRAVRRLSRFLRATLRTYIPEHVLALLPTLARLGLACRGLLYIVIAALAFEAGGPKGAGGAISYLGTGAGRWLVLLMLIGFAGYGGWRLSDGILGLDNPLWSRKALFKRTGSLVSAGIHFVLADQCFEFVIDPREWTGGLTTAAAMILSLPALWLILLLGSAAVGFAGLSQMIKGARASFMIRFYPEKRYDWLSWIGRLGYVARGLALLWLAYILLLGAFDPQHARIGGVGLALVTLSDPLTKVMAGGLLIFGLYCLAEAWYRRVAPLSAPVLSDGRARGISRNLREVQ